MMAGRLVNSSLQTGATAEINRPPGASVDSIKSSSIGAAISQTCRRFNIKVEITAGLGAVTSPARWRVFASINLFSG
jgi:hypothetical protein